MTSFIPSTYFRCTYINTIHNTYIYSVTAYIVLASLGSSAA
nr:MAG TPA: hypothetical protein [Caudoviricetes sp.]